MGRTDAVAATFDLTVVDGREWLSLHPTSSTPAASWLSLQSLKLAAPSDLSGGGAATRLTAVGRAAELKNRRLLLKEATLLTDVERLQEALSWCPLAEAGLSDVRVWTGPGGLRLAGRCAAGGLEAPFTIRVAIEPRGDGRRRLSVSFSDVRLYAPLPLPAPLVGAAVARALGATLTPGSATTSNVRLAAHAVLDIDPLEATLVRALVANGWRLPDLTRVWLQSVTQHDGTAQLRFASDGHPTERMAALDPGTAPAAATWLEGERLPDSLGAAEQLLFGDDWRTAEAAYRKVVIAHPRDRSARARLLAVRAADLDAAAVAEVGALSEGLLAEWPEFVPALLHGAFAAVKGGDRQRAATLFARLAKLADDRGEREDALLTRAAAAAAAAAAVGTAAVEIAPAEGAPDSVAAAAGSGNVTAKTRALYTAESDPDRRTEALGEMLHGFEQLPVERQHAAYASFGRVAEATGDFEYAEEAYWRATSVAGDPVGRADDLMAHARVLLSRGNLAAAIAELEEALVLAPEQVGTLVLLAEQAMEAEDWERARGLYALLDRMPGGDQAMPRPILLLRRARLARAAGDGEEAEACYRILAALDARQIEARQVLAQIALERHDLNAAAQWLEEVLQMLPLEAVAALLEARQQLAEIYSGLGDWPRARPYIELVLAQDPANVAMLERAAEIYDQLGEPAAAAEAFAKLSRIHVDRRARAEALLRAGEIWQDRLGDEGHAFDIYLRASDIDPTYAPTAVRLIGGYWRRGQFAEAAEVVSDLRHAGAVRPGDTALALRLAIANALARAHAPAGEAPANDEPVTEQPASDEEAELFRSPWDMRQAALVFTELAGHVAGRPPEEVAPAIAVLERWRRGQPDAAPDVARDQHDQPLEELWVSLSERVLADGATAPAGLAAALAWIDTHQPGATA